MTPGRTHLFVWLHRFHLLCLEGRDASFLAPYLPVTVSSFDRIVNQGTLHSQAKRRACGPSWTHQALGILETKWLEVICYNKVSWQNGQIVPTSLPLGTDLGDLTDLFWSSFPRNRTIFSKNILMNFHHRTGYRVYSFIQKIFITFTETLLWPWHSKKQTKMQNIVFKTLGIRQRRTAIPKRWETYEMSPEITSVFYDLALA